MLRTTPLTLLRGRRFVVAPVVVRHGSIALKSSAPLGSLFHPTGPFFSCRLASTSTPSSPPSSSSSSPSSARVGAASTGARGHGNNAFRAPPNVGSGRPGEATTANPFKSWEHMNHTWLLLMCVGCLCAGLLAGYVVEVDETKLKPKFSKLAVMESAAKQYEFRPDLAATSIRVAFVLAARRAGFPAETLDESCAVPDGLVDMAGVLNYLGTTYGASMEDAVSLAAIAGIKYLGGPYETLLEQWQWGRNDSDDAPPRNVPADPKQKLFSIPTILHGLGDLSDEECVALMACHSVGEFHENVSGIEDATHIGSRYQLSNAYYTFLLENEKKAFFPLPVARTEDNKDVKALPTNLVCIYADGKATAKGAKAGGSAADANPKKEKKRGKKRQCAFNQTELDAMLRGKTWRPIVERFARDEAAWGVAFQSAFGKLINGHFRKLRVYTEPDAKATA